MPPGIPVATMAIDGAMNAAIFAAKIVAVARPEMWASLSKYMRLMEEQVLEKASELESQGYQKYLSKQ